MMPESVARIAVVLITIAFSLTQTTAGQQPGPAPRRVAIRAAHLVDPTSGQRTDDVVVLVEGHRIAQVGSRLPIPSGVETIDLGRSTLLPGLIDVHTHLTTQSEEYYADTFRRSPIDAAVRAPSYAGRTLAAGFTTVRDVGAGEYVDVALKNAIKLPDGKPLSALRVVNAPSVCGSMGFKPMMIGDGKKLTRRAGSLGAPPRAVPGPRRRAR